MLELSHYDLIRKFENYACMRKVEDLISQILQTCHVQNQLCLYMRTCEPLFVKFVFLIQSILLYAAGDMREAHGVKRHWSCTRHAMAVLSWQKP
jgi:hypothetical protein